MNVLIDVNHPAHVHFFRNLVNILKSEGHHVVITAREKDVTLKLLQSYSLPFEVLSKRGSGVFGLGVEWLVRQIKLAQIIRREKIDLCLSIGGTFCVHTARILGVPALIFYDSERAELQNMLSYPFATLIITPDTYQKDLGARHVKYAGFHELAYLHPKHFKPNKNVLSELGVAEGETFFVVRFVSWQASHDVGRHGFSGEEKRTLIHFLEKHGKVFISSEKPLEEEFKKYAFNTLPEKMHDVLCFSSMLLTDSQTMTTEAAILGVPAVRYNSFAGPKDMGNFLELENKYNLIYSFREFDKALNKVKELLSQTDLKQAWQAKRERLLSEKIDVTEFLVKTIRDHC